MCLLIEKLGDGLKGYESQGKCEWAGKLEQVLPFPTPPQVIYDVTKSVQ